VTSEVSTFRCRALRREDVEAVVEIERCCFESPWTPGQFRHELKVPFSRTVLAWDETGEPARLAGYICRWAVGDEFSILNLAVAPDYHRRGLGRQLVTLVLDEARSAGATTVILEVREKNDAARALYSPSASSRPASGATTTAGAIMPWS
jgi:ribosomal-protein-alanine N-acetyltransferase